MYCNYRIIIFSRSYSLTRIDFAAASLFFLTLSKDEIFLKLRHDVEVHWIKTTMWINDA